MRRVLIYVSLAGAFALAAVGPAAAAPPSTNSAVNDYQESLPGAGGQGSGNGSGGGSGDATQGGSGGSQGGSGASAGASGASAGTPLSPQTANELADQGASGRGLADVTESTGAASSQNGQNANAGASASGATTSTADADSGGFFGALGDALKSFVGGDSGSGSDSGGGGMGAAFPVLVAGGLLGAGALLFTRRKRL